MPDPKNTSHQRLVGSSRDLFAFMIRQGPAGVIELYVTSRRVKHGDKTILGTIEQQDSGAWKLISQTMAGEFTGRLPVHVAWDAWEAYAVVKELKDVEINRRKWFGTKSRDIGKTTL